MSRIVVGVLWCLAVPLLTIGFYTAAVWGLVLGVVSLLAGGWIGRAWVALLPFGLIAAVALLAYVSGAHGPSSDDDAGGAVWWLVLIPTVFAGLCALAGVLARRVFRRRHSAHR